MPVFKPSLAVVHKIVEASPSFAWEMRARALMEHPKERADIDWVKAKRVLGEQVVGRIATLARDLACVRPGSTILFSDPSGKINAEWEKSFFAYLQLSPRTRAADEIRAGLARDLSCWVKKHSQDAREIGLSLDSEDRIHLLCERLQPVLDPIPD